MDYNSMNPGEWGICKSLTGFFYEDPSFANTGAGPLHGEV